MRTLPIMKMRLFHSKTARYVAVRTPWDSGRYAIEIITVESALIAVGTFMLGSIIPEHNRIYTTLESLDSGLNVITAVIAYLSCVFVLSCLVALRFYSVCRGLPIALVVISLLLMILGFAEYDNALLNIHPSE